MTMKANNLEEAKALLKTKLPEFLAKNNIHPAGKNPNKYRSIYSDTIDRNPSMHLYKKADGSYNYWCFSTGRGGDIFVANNVITNAPLLGHEFVNNNVLPLCEMFDIEYTPRPLTAEEIEEMNIRSIYEMIKEKITMSLGIEINKQDKCEIEQNVIEYLKQKDLFDVNIARQYGLGYVSSYDDLIRELEECGATKEFLIKIGIHNFIFNKHNLLFTQFDEFGKAKGFAARNCNFSKENNVGSKYYNIENNRIYNKRNSLYNIHNAIKKRKKNGSMSLYICEGYSDAIALDRNDFRSGALCSTNLTDDHISFLQKIGETDIVFILDGDAAGQKNTGRIITEVMKGILILLASEIASTSLLMVNNGTSHMSDICLHILSR